MLRKLQARGFVRGPEQFFPFAREEQAGAEAQFSVTPLWPDLKVVPRYADTEG
jgi:hypothetical protein